MTTARDDDTNTTVLPNAEAAPAVGIRVDRPVRPCAWLREQREEYEGPATLAPLMFLGYAEVKPYSDLHGATYEPLYSAAALADAVAAERERWRTALWERAQKIIESPHAVAADEALRDAADELGF